MTSLAPLKTSPRIVQAFSLIEVVLAMAIVAFALLAIIGMLPVGLATMRDSQNDQAIATIANQLRGDLQQISFGTGAGTLNDLQNTPYYYTAEGLKTDLTGTNEAGQPFYEAQFTVANAGVNGNGFVIANAVPANAANITVTLTYPYPSLTQKTAFNLFATKQVGL